MSSTMKMLFSLLFGFSYYKYHIDLTEMASRAVSIRLLRPAPLSCEAACKMSLALSHCCSLE